MATCSVLIGTADTGTSPNTSGAFSPSSGDLLVVFVEADTTVDTSDTLTSSIGGFTFSKVTTALRSSSTHLHSCFVADALVSDTSSQTVTWTHGGSDVSGGTVITVYAIAGMSKYGATAIRQSKKAENVTGPATPAVTFDASCLTGNPTIGSVANLSNPAGVTPPTSWTEDATYGDLGYASPNAGLECCHRDSGFTGTTITWGASTGSHSAIIVELDASSSDPSITNVDGDNSIYPGQTSITANCANMPATASAKIVSGSNSITMSNYDDTSVNAPTFDAPSLASFLSAGIKFGTVTFEIYN